jgi:inhibitor of cysteine peptidase
MGTERLLTGHAHMLEQPSEPTALQSERGEGHQPTRRRALRLALLAAGLSGPAGVVVGCAQPILGSAEPPRASEVVMADMRTFRLAMVMGQISEVRLPSNPSTGYRWALMEASTDLLNLLDHGFVAGRNDMVGAPGEERWTFQAVKIGSGELRFEYRRPWEPLDIAPAQRATYRVEVR